MYQNDYEVQVLVNNKPVKEYLHNSKYFIEGRKDTSFKIKIKNNGFRRIIAVPTVDGLSVMDGKPASVNSSGYVIDGRSSMTVDGWRVSNDEVSTFVFCSKNKSYSAKTKKADGNQGVIGVAVFREKQYVRDIFNVPYWGEQSVTPSPPFIPTVYNLSENLTLQNGSLEAGDTSYAMSASNCSSGPLRSATKGVSQKDLNLGTGWGDLKNSESVTVEIERESSPDSVFELYYATKSALKKMGVNVGGTNNVVTAFPGNFCKPPQE